MVRVVFFDCVKNKYCRFDGRARRAEYWYFVLVSIIANILALIPIVGILVFIVYSLICLALILLGLSVSVRRLHDTGKSGWWVVLSVIPILNLILLFFYILDSDPSNNEYGSNPKI